MENPTAEPAVEDTKMKITKRQLRRIIKEEKQSLVENSRMRNAQWATDTYGNEEPLNDVTTSIRGLILDLKLELGREKGFDPDIKTEIANNIVTLQLYKALNSLGMSDQAQALFGTLK